MRNQLNRLIKAESKYKSAIGNLESALVDKIKFDFSVENQQSDGFCILNIGTANLALLASCIVHIEQHGKLSVEDHLEMSF